MRNVIICFILFFALFSACKKQGNFSVVGSWHTEEVFESGKNIQKATVNFLDDGTMTIERSKKDKVVSAIGKYAINGDELDLKILSFEKNKIKRDTQLNIQVENFRVGDNKIRMKLGKNEVFLIRD